jgi:hypothetical protein
MENVCCTCFVFIETDMGDSPWDEGPPAASGDEAVSVTATGWFLFRYFNQWMGDSYSAFSKKLISLSSVEYIILTN